jgi:protoporphyrinogen oxidase
MSSDEHVAVIGGGITGITAALRLAESGRRVELYEARDHLGGLSDSYSWDGVSWDRFYHVILSTDTRLLELIEDLGLSSELFWSETRSGFYRDGRLVSMSSIGDFVRFPFLSMWQKLRLGIGILGSTGIKDTDKLDRIYVREWLTRIFGRRVYERLWDPLLRSKLGEARHGTSAAFIQATIARLYGARSGESKIERMGHVRGGYRTILAAATRRLAELGVVVHLGERVDSLDTVAHGARNGRTGSFGGDVSPTVRVRSAADVREYHKVLLTVPATEVLRVTGREQSADAYWQALGAVRYLGVLCLFVVLDRGLSPYYVTNLLDTSLPFTGIIEVSNIVGSKEFGGRHLVYLPKYVTSDDPLAMASDQSVTDLFLKGLRTVHTDLPPEAVLHTKLFRERHVQPLQEVNYLDAARGFRTPISGVYLANSSMLYNCTLNNNAAVRLAEDVVEIMTASSAASEAVSESVHAHQYTEVGNDRI